MKNSHWFKRRDYIVSDLNISMRLLDQILHGSSSHWWYRSESWLLPQYTGPHLALWKQASSPHRNLWEFSPYICMNISPLGRTVILELKGLLIVCRLPANRSTEILEAHRIQRWWSVVFLSSKGMTVTLYQCFKYQTYFQNWYDRG